MSAGRGGHGEQGGGGEVPGRLQPFDERDLQRHPPRDAECRGERLRLRDYLDSELSAADAERLEGHVHECRDCALALSRAELEVLRLRKAFEEERRELADQPAGLTAGILARIEPEFDRAFGDVGLDDVGFEDGLASDGGRGADDGFGDAETGSDVTGSEFEPVAEGSGTAPERSDASGGWTQPDREFTGRVMAQVRREWSSSGPWSRLRRQLGARRGYAFVAAAAALLLVGLGVGWSLFQPQGGADARLMPFAVREAVRADRLRPLDPTADGMSAFAEGSSGGGGRRVAESLAAGDLLGLEDVVAVRDAGRLVLSQNQRYGPSGPLAGRPIGADAEYALELALVGSGLARLRHAGSLDRGPLGGVDDDGWSVGPVLELERGAADLEVAASRGGGFRVELGGFASLIAQAGSEVTVSLRDVLRADFPAAGSQVGRVEVRRGRAILLFDGRPQVVQAERIARFDSLGSFELEPTVAALMSAGAGSALTRAEATRPSAATGRVEWTGSVVRAETNAAVAAARVRVVVGSGTSDHQIVETAADGSFTFEASESGPPVALVSVAPGPRDPDLGVEPGRVVALEPFGGKPFHLETIRLSEGRHLSGRVLLDGQPQQGVEVVAMVVDELFGMAERLEGRTTRTDADGNYQLVGLPNRLEVHESLVVLVPEQRQRAPVATAEVAWHGAAPGVAIDRRRQLDIELPDARSLRIRDLPTNGGRKVLQAVPGLPLAAMAIEHNGFWDPATGDLVLSGVGPGPMFLFDRENKRLQPLTVTADGSGLRIATGEDGTRVADRLDRLDQPFGRDRLGREEPDAWVAPGHRLGSFYRADDGEAVVRYLTVHDPRRAIAQRAQIFIERADGTLEFLGEHHGGSGLPFPVPAERPFRIIAVGLDDGSFGIVEVTADDPDISAAIEVAEPGAVDLSRQLAGADRSLCAFEMVEGPLAGRTFWRPVGGTAGLEIGQLPAGRYRVVLADGRVLQCRVEPGRATRPTERPQADRKDEKGR